MKTIDPSTAAVLARALTLSGCFKLGWSDAMNGVQRLDMFEDVLEWAMYTEGHTFGSELNGADA